MSRHVGLIGVVGITVLMLGCQDRFVPKAEEKKVAAKPQAITIPAIQAHVVRIKLPKPEVCQAKGCTRYDLQSIKTNVAWIDQFFQQRIEKSYAAAFSTQPNEKMTSPDGQLGLSQNTTSVRYLGQNYRLATFMQFNYAYNAGAAHGMYYRDYVVFDLQTQKRLQLDIILKPALKPKLTQLLYTYNRAWLEQHEITQEQFKLSENFYYAADGLVFVYPLYALAPYDEGMSELKLPYSVVKTLLKPEYLPSLPEEVPL